MKKELSLPACLFTAGMIFAAPAASLFPKSDFTLKGKSIVEWECSGANLAQVKEPKEEKAVQITLRKIRENYYNTILNSCRFRNLKQGKYRFSLMVKTSGTKINTVQFYNPLKVKGSKTTYRYSAVPAKKLTSSQGKWVAIQGDFLIPENCESAQFGIEIRSSDPAEITFANPVLARIQ